MCNACFIDHRGNVQITNRLENGMDLTLHCESKDDDLGEHVLHKDESYNFQLLSKRLWWNSILL